jgi:transposase
MEPLSGNASDQASFPELIDRHVSHLQNAHGFDYVVADSALYSADHVKKLSGNSIKFITRVPETIDEAQQVIRETNPTGLKQLADGYRAREHFSEYGGAEQRWLVVYSEAAEERAKKQVWKKVDREHREEAKAFSELIWREFACREDAKQALETFEADLKASTLSEKRVSRGTHYAPEAQILAGSSVKDSSKGESEASAEEARFVEIGECWFVGGTLTPSEAYEAQLLKRRSLFILATNELDKKQLSAEEILQGYKGQVRVERGFRFLKDPLFLATAFYLQSERRIMALLMVMTLCLLVYSALEWRIREGLRVQELAFPDQKGNPTQKPTARWVFQSFRGIHLLLVDQKRLVLNLQEHHRSIVTVLGHRYETLYASYPT